VNDRAARKAAAQPPAVVYLARGADDDPLPRFERFVRSYRRFSAGEEHALFVVFKGFDSEAQLREGRAVFSALSYQPIFTTDDAFDLGAYRDAARQIQRDRLCFLNSNSEIAGESWLAKLSANFALPYSGLVGATGSLESLYLLDHAFPVFPNVHLRSNAFMIRREIFLHAMAHVPLLTKKDAFLFESGPNSMTRKLFFQGLSVLVVGRNGRGYPLDWWTHSRTFRLADQSNLLVHDNVTRQFAALPFPEKQAVARRSWGRLLDGMAS
jgi:hypothetical protein